MARLLVRDERLVVRLNALEKLADLRLRSPAVPVVCVRSIDVVSRTGRLRLEVDFGFAGNTAPFAGLATASSHGRYAGGRAAVFAYLGRSAVRVDLDDARWRLFLVSSREPELVAQRLRDSMAGTGDARG